MLHHHLLLFICLQLVYFLYLFSVESSSAEWFIIYWIFTVLKTKFCLSDQLFLLTVIASGHFLGSWKSNEELISPFENEKSLFTNGKTKKQGQILRA